MSGDQRTVWEVLDVNAPQEGQNPAQIVYTALFRWKVQQDFTRLAEALRAFSEQDFKRYPTAGIALLGGTRGMPLLQTERLALGDRIREAFIVVNGSAGWLNCLLKG
jgi:hypothetical protein